MVEKINRPENLSGVDLDIMHDAQDVMEEVLLRMKDSFDKYGSAYALADIKAELNSEFLDIVGWPLLQVVRMKRLLDGRLEKLTGDYLDKFLEYHDDAYLTSIRDAINSELTKRSK